MAGGRTKLAYLRVDADPHECSVWPVHAHDHTMLGDARLQRHHRRMGISRKRRAIIMDGAPPWIDGSAPTQLVFGQAEQTLRSAIARHDGAARVLHDHALRHAREHGTIPFFARWPRRWKTLANLERWERRRRDGAGSDFGALAQRQGALVRGWLRAAVEGPKTHGAKLDARPRYASTVQTPQGVKGESRQKNDANRRNTMAPSGNAGAPPGTRRFFAAGILAS